MLTKKAVMEIRILSHRGMSIRAIAKELGIMRYDHVNLQPRWTAETFHLRIRTTMHRVGFEYLPIGDLVLDR